MFTVKSTLSLFSAYQYSSMNTTRIFFSDEESWFICLRPRHFVGNTIRRTRMLPPLVARPYKLYIHKKVTKCWPNLNRDRCSLAYFECLSCSHSICIFFVPDVQRDAFCFTFRATRSQTLYVLNKSTVTQVSSRLVTCAECRHTAAPFVCPTIPNIKSNVGRNDSHHIVAFCNFRWPL